MNNKYTPTQYRRTLSPEERSQSKKKARLGSRMASFVSSSYRRSAGSPISEAQQKMDQLDNLSAYHAFKHLYEDEYLEARSKGSELSAKGTIMNLIRDDLRGGGSAIYNRAYDKGDTKMREKMASMGGLQSFLDSYLKGGRLQVQNAFDVQRMKRQKNEQRSLGLAKQRQIDAAKDQYIQGQIEGQGGLGRSDYASRYQAMKNIGAQNPLKTLRSMDTGSWSGPTGMYQQEYDRLEGQRKKEQQKKFGSEFDTLYNRSKSR
jgi:hypothetical protein